MRCSSWFIATIVAAILGAPAASVGLAAGASDKVRLIRGTEVGEVTNTTPFEVTITKSTANDRKIAINEIKAIVFDGEPGELSQARTSVGNGAFAKAQQQLEKVDLNQIRRDVIKQDVEYYQANGSSVAATVADIEMIMNHVGLIYQAQVAISYVETGIIVRTAEPDPYSSSDRDVLLCQLRNEWNANIAIPRDTAHLFTGKDINGSTIGYAYRGVICFGDAGGCNGGSAAYGFSQSRWTTDLTSRIELTAHELGHNWDCCHCDESSCTGGGPDPDCGIMNSFVNGSLTFEQRGLASITAWRNNANCVDPWFNPLYVNWSYSGPENGSAAQPFNTVAEGSVNALVGGEIRLTPGNYPENLTLQHIVTLKRNGASGIVRIGTP